MSHFDFAQCDIDFFEAVYIMPLTFKERKKILKSVNTLDLTPIRVYSEAKRSG